MKEVVLRMFFTGDASAEDLSRDTADASTQTSHNVQHLRVEPMARRFSVNADHLVKLCDAVLESKLDPARLEAIGFAMIGSDAFEWDVDVADGDRVADVLNQWASPEINYRLSLANVEKWKRFLKTGESTFTRVDLSP